MYIVTDDFCLHYLLHEIRGLGLWWKKCMMSSGKLEKGEIHLDLLLISIQICTSFMLKSEFKFSAFP